MLISGLTLISRIAGLVRDALCARYFGAGPIWSSFALAFLIPNLFRRLFGEGALAAALIPEYTQVLQSDPERARRLASATILTLITILAIACVALEIVVFMLLTLTPLGTHGTLTLQLTMIMLPFAMLICLTAALGGMLQCHSVFAPTAASPIILNLCIIAGAVGAITIFNTSHETAIYTVAFCVLVAGCIQTTWSYLALRSVGGWTWNTSGTRQHLRSIAHKMMPVIIGLGTLQLNTLFDGLLAGWPVLVGPEISLPLVGTHDYPLDADANAVLFYAQRLYQFPLGVFGIALATAVFPTLARHATDSERFTQTLRRGVRLTLFIGVPASIGIIAVRSDLVTALFRGGSFDTTDARRVSDVLLAYSPAIWAATTSHTLTRAFYALGQTRTPMRIAMLAVAVNVVLDLALIVPLRESGLALATSLSSLVQVVVLWVVLRRTQKLALGREGKRAALITLTSSVVMGLVLLVSGLGFRSPEGMASASVLLRLIAGVLVGGTIFVLLARLFSQEELRWLTDSLRRRKTDDST